jgi:predicted anti-sigma-YlaC factor YlaD
MTRWRRTTACERAAQWISLELDGELGRLEQAALDRHLRRCDRCRATTGQMGAFTLLLREAPLLGPARAVVVEPPVWARRRARAALRGSVLALAAAVAGIFSIGVLPHSGRTPPSSVEVSWKQQQVVARDHARSEPRLFVVADEAPAPSLSVHPLL